MEVIKQLIDILEVDEEYMKSIRHIVRKHIKDNEKEEEEKYIEEYSDDEKKEQDKNIEVIKEKKKRK